MSYLLAVLGGTLYFLGFVGFNQWYLSWFCLVPLFFALEGVGVKKGFFIGWLFGTVALTGGFYWLTYTIHVFAYMSWAAAGALCLLLCIAQALQFALFGILYAWLKKRTPLSPLFLGTAAYVATEFATPQLFPHYLANSQWMNIPLIQIADITGALGVTALLVFVNVCVYLSIKKGFFEKRIPWGDIALALSCVIAVLCYGYLRLPVVKAETERCPKIRFGITQANLGIREKSRAPGRSLKLNQLQTMGLKGRGAQIVLWPETAVQRPLFAPHQKRVPASIIDDLGVPILFGAIEKDFKGSRPLYYNIAVLSDGDGNILGVYKKRKLLMLGEYIPFGEVFPILYKWMPYITRMAPGNSYEPLRFNEYLLGVNICYEGILPRFIGRIMKYSPDVLINLTNDNWFGRTHEPLQHLVLSAFRSVEHRRWLVRSTNTGISAFVDATGRIVERSPLMESATLIHDVPMMKMRTVYSRYGDWLGWLAIAATVGSFALRRKR